MGGPSQPGRQLEAGRPPDPARGCQLAKVLRGIIILIVSIIIMIIMMIIIILIIMMIIIIIIC